jgi:hypothetical protein
MYSGYITPKNEQAAYRRTALSYNPSAAQYGHQVDVLRFTPLCARLMPAVGRLSKNAVTESQPQAIENRHEEDFQEESPREAKHNYRLLDSQAPEER